LKVLIFTSKNKSGKAVFNALKKELPAIEIEVIRETASNRKNLIEGRVKKHGLFYVANQLLFQVIFVRVLKLLARKRIEQYNHILDFSGIPSQYLNDVETINDKSTLEIIGTANPSLIIVSGTRIIKNDILSRLNCPIVNLHAGITPEYRGVHGMYWALRNKEPDMAGMTLHHVDSGIDTGEIISQKKCSYSVNDSFVTYPYLQLKVGTELLIDYIQSGFKNGTRITNNNKGPLYYHPTATSYLFFRLFHNVK